MAKFCSNCGAQLAEGSKFCPSCGQPVEAPAPRESAPQQQPVQQLYQQTPQAPAQQGYQQTYQQPPQQGYQQTYQRPPQQGYQQSYQQPAPKKSKAGLVIAILAVLLAGLGAVACFVWPGFLKDPGATEPPTTAPIQTEVPGLTTQAPDTQAPDTQAPTGGPATEAPQTEAPATVAGDLFQDLSPDEYWYPEFLWAYQNGVVEGGAANPYARMSRGDLVLLLWRAFGSPAVTQALPFTDVSAGSDLYPALAWAYSSGIVSASSNGLFNPEGDGSMAQAVTMLCAALGVDGSGLPRAYIDVNENKYYYAPVNWAYWNGLLERDETLELYPDDFVWRGEFVSWLARAKDPSLALSVEPPQDKGFASMGIQANLRLNETAYFLAATQQDSSLRYRLSVTAESYEVFEAAEGYEALEGYEWRVGTVLIGYGDPGAENYAYSLYAMPEDARNTDLFLEYYEEDENGTVTSWVLVDGSPMRIYVLDLKADSVDGALYRVTYEVHVPKGYDGFAVVFCASDTLEAVDGEFYEAYKAEDFVIFRYE